MRVVSPTREAGTFAKKPEEVDMFVMLGCTPQRSWMNFTVERRHIYMLNIYMLSERLRFSLGSKELACPRKRIAASFVLGLSKKHLAQWHCVAVPMALSVGGPCMVPLGA